MADGIQKEGQEKWLDRLVALGSFTRNEFATMSYRQTETWEVFEKKIITPIPLMVVRDIFNKYNEHLFLKLISNGYDRVEVRHTLEPLFQYDEEGNFLMEHPVRVMREDFDLVVERVQKTHPQFSFGFIYACFKMWDNVTSY